MIAAGSSNRSFRKLGRYLVEPKNDLEGERVASSSSRNLPTDDPQVGVVIMTATARENVRVDRAAYHLQIAFDPSDNVDREKMERVADALLRDLGLHEHQALIVAHADRRHAHMHILVNRVHPETGRVWDRWQDRARIQEILRGQEHALGLRAVESSLAPRARAQERHRETTLERGDTQEPAAHHSRRQEGRYSAIRADLDLYERIGETARERYRADVAAARAQERLNLIELAAQRVERAADAFDKSLKRVYVDPIDAKRQFVEATRREGAKPVSDLAEQPDSFGALRTVESRGFLGRAQSSDVEAREAAHDAADRARAWIGEHRRLIETVAHGRDPGADKPVPIGASREWVNEAQRDLTKAYDAVRMTQTAAQSLPPRDELEFRLGKAIRRLTPQEFEHLRQTISGRRLALAYQFRRNVRDAVLGRDEEV